MQPTVWEGCYSGSWKGIIVDDAYKHPAKYSRALIERIYDHMLAKGWLKKGDVVLDPFGGVALGGIVGAYKGIRWVGCELEEKFVALGNANIEKHRRNYETLGEPVPVLVQGDSRKLASVLAQHFDSSVSSPPFSGTEQPTWSQTRAKKDYRAFTRGDGTKRDETHTGDTPGQLSAMPSGVVPQRCDSVVSSPPFGASQTSTDASKKQKESGYFAASTNGTLTGAYAEIPVGTPGQLGAMDCSVSSPPYFTPQTHDRGHIMDGGTPAMKKCNNSAAPAGYVPEKTPGQLGAMAEGAISSPPYASSNLNPGDSQRPEALIERLLAEGKTEEAEMIRRDGSGKASGLRSDGYGIAEGQLAAANQETFWGASRLIVSQVHSLLKPRGYAAWVVKHYVKSGSIVDFPGQWQAMCEQCGFETVEIVHASLVKERKTRGLFGEEHVERKKKASFFRNLYEAKHPENAIDFETVIFMRRVP